MDSIELQRLKNKFDIIGNDAELNRALEMAVAVAPTDLTVLISGESGTGKEVLPQIIHQNSRRKSGKFLAINCGGIPESTINAELFGHEKGSFTGAIAERKGYFEEADGGTLFLDEIGELPRPTQALLLRVLQNGEFIKVGASKVEKTDVRVIAATNVDLAYAVATGKFRSDLYYRLNGIQINTPSLRERKDDIVLLFRKFSSDFAEKYNLCKLSLSHEAIMLLTSYRWPGNIRQLKNIAERAAALLSQPVTPGSERVEVSAAALRGLMPEDNGTMLPAAPAAVGTGTMSDSEKQAMVSAIMGLKQEVDSLKLEIEALKSGADDKRLGTGSPATTGNFVGIPENEPEEQTCEPSSPEEETQTVKSIRDIEDELIFNTIKKYGSVKEAARELKLSERTLYRKLAAKKKK